MVTKILLPIVSAALLVFAALHVRNAAKAIPELPPPVEPPKSPFVNTVAGAGIIEPETENISIGSHLPGVAVEVPVRVGQSVKPGDPLFRLDDRQLQAELKMRTAAVASAQAQLTRLEHEPRPEVLRMSETQLADAEAKRADALNRWNRARRLATQNATTEEVLITTEQAFRSADAMVERAKADLAMTKAGAWEYDKLVARMTLEEAKARVQQTETDIARLTVRALVPGEVLQVNVRPGEFVGAPPSQALIVLGRIRQLHLRVDIDEYDIPRYSTSAPARASLKGQPQHSFPLKFVRVEPYVVPKRSLTGDNTERVDTRVLQVIYAIDARDQQLYVGQQMDVFIDGRE